MIKSLVQIGNMVKNGVLEQFDVRPGTNLISLDFKVSDSRKDISVEREITSDFLIQTGYRGVTRGSGKEYGVIFPEDKIKYLGLGGFVSASKFSLLNIYEELKSKRDIQKKELTEKLNKIMSQFYEKKGKANYKLKNDEEILKQIKNKTGNSPYYLQVCIDGVPLWKVYKHHTEVELIKDRGCSICPKNGILKEFDTNQLKFIKFFGKDKLGFYPEMSLDNQWKVLPLCQECAESLVLADLYLKENRLYTTIAKEQRKQLVLLILPEISAWQKLSSNFLKRTLSKLKEASDVLVNWKELNQFEVYAEKIFDRSDVKLHILISVYDGQTLKIYSSLNNIPPSRIKQLALSMKTVFLFISENIKLSLFSLYKILAGKAFAQSKRAPLIKEKFAEIFKNLILGNPIPDIVFIKPGLELVSWQFNQKDKGWVNSLQTIEGFLIIKELMKGENLCAEGGKEMKSILEDAKRYLQQNPIYRGTEGELRQGLFLLGYILSKIAGKQSKKGLKDAILNKIQFRGMNKKQILSLVNQTFDYMRIYGLQEDGNNLELFGEITKIFDNNLLTWNLTSEETVYFILSGYAFRTSRAIKLAREKSLNKEETHD